MNRCCESHFSWRIKQCMNNNRPVYIPVGDITCEKKADIDDDWDNKECTNDDLTPEYMLILQRDDLLYRSKEE